MPPLLDLTSVRTLRGTIYIEWPRRASRGIDGKKVKSSVKSVARMVHLPACLFENSEPANMEQTRSRRWKYPSRGPSAPLSTSPDLAVHNYTLAGPLSTPRPLSPPLRPSSIGRCFFHFLTFYAAAHRGCASSLPGLPYRSIFVSTIIELANYCPREWVCDEERLRTERVRHGDTVYKIF